MGLMDILFKKEEVPVQRPETKPTAGAVASTIPVSGDNNFHAYLDGEIRKRNAPGPDYLEFSDTLKALDGQPLDEKTKYIINYTTYQALGLTADKIVTSANTYLSVVDREKTEFDQSLTQARAQKISAREAEIQAEQQSIQDLSAQIQKKQLNIQKLSSDIEKDKIYLQGQEVAFNSAYQARKTLIEEHISKIKTYLYATATK